MKSKTFNWFALASFLERHTDIALAMLLLSILCMLILPLPTFLLDFAIAANFAFTLLLLIVAIYIRSPLELAVFPSLLLLTTLFRLGLSVATTKMILLEADAGSIVETFGSLMVGGNIVVGLVIFLLLCAVQLLVVAKGADRVAEVAARFTLDAIPGKQMSIDADLRTGTIDVHEAKRRRETLQQEIQLNGALDGAMKFVKGDAVIGLVIAAINITGGIVIGMVMRNMAFSEALQTYVILTIGDGLVSQIPSLIVAIAAGLIITRGESRADANEHLGQRIYEQLTQRPKAILLASIVCIGFALVPGFPAFQFLFLAALLALVGFSQRRREAMISVSQQAPMPNMARDGMHYIPSLLDGLEFGTSLPLRIRVGQTAFESIDAATFDHELGRMRQYLMDSLGLPFPGVSMVGEPSFIPERFTIEVEGLAVVEGTLFGEAGLVYGEATDPYELSRDHAGYLPGVTEAWWLPTHELESAVAAGLSVAYPHQVLSAFLNDVCEHHAASFVGSQETQFLLDRLNAVFPEVVKGMREGVPIPMFAGVLSSLLKEGVSIRNLRAISEAILILPAGERSQAAMLEVARIGLRQSIILGHLDIDSGQFHAVTVDPEWEALMAEALRVDASGEPFMALAMDDLRGLDEAIRNAISSGPTSGVILTSSILRCHLLKVVRGIAPNWRVLALQEVPENYLPFESVGLIGMNA